MMKVDEFIRRIKDVANHKTIYVRGCFGAPMTPANKKRYTKNNDYNLGRAAKINACTADTFGFDCICLVKAVLGLWDGSVGLSYGGTKVNQEAHGISYGPDHVPDVGADGVVAYLQGVSTDFSTIIPGELLCMKGHVGVYVGDGLAVECTPKWTGDVQYSNIRNLGYKSAAWPGNWRTWEKHGRLPWIDYTGQVIEEKPQEEANATPAEVYYTVVKGDALSKIAKSYGTTVEAIRALNPAITNPHKIYVGQKVRVK